jgi:hypothetical protein
LVRIESRSVGRELQASSQLRRRASEGGLLGEHPANPPSQLLGQVHEVLGGHPLGEAQETEFLHHLLLVDGQRVPACDESVGGDAERVHVIFRRGLIAGGGAATELPVMELSLRAPVVSRARRVRLASEGGSAFPGTGAEVDQEGV